MSPETINPVNSQTAQILDERARLLAKPIAERRADRDERECVIFTIKPETYAIDCRYVRRITRSSGIAAIPGTPPFVAGVIRVHEEIHSVFDLRALLGAQRQAITNDAKIIALGDQRIEFCLLADEVVEIIAIAAPDIHARDFDRARDGKKFIRGVTNDAILVLDTAALLRDETLYIGGGATHI
ncbi:MAG: putative CheW protein [Rhodospirillales bacterium]|nr:putative CheW protein [Rhodospirillales bacterium]